MPNIHDFDRLYRARKTALGVSDGAVRIKLGQVGPAKLRVLTHVTVENRDGTVYRCRLGIHSGGKDYYLDEIMDLVAGELGVSRSDILLGEGDVFFSEFTTTTTGNVLVMTCIGWTKGLKPK